MATKKSLGLAIYRARMFRGLRQEEFSSVSSRTYISTLERGEKSPTIEKLNAIAKRMKLHPMTILAMSYSKQGFRGDTEALLKRVAAELAQIQAKEQEDT